MPNVPNGYFPGTSPAERRAFFDTARIIAALKAENESLQTRVEELEERTEPTAWTNLTLVNGWANYGGFYAPAGWQRIGNIVHVRGTIAGVAATTHCFTLPPNARPDLHCNIQPTVRISGVAGGYLDINGSTGFCLVQADTSPLAAAAVSFLFEFSVLA